MCSVRNGRVLLSTRSVVVAVLRCPKGASPLSKDGKPHKNCAKCSPCVRKWMGPSDDARNATMMDDTPFFSHLLGCQPEPHLIGVTRKRLRTSWQVIDSNEDEEKEKEGKRKER